MATRRTAAACDMGWPSSSRGRNEVPDSLAVVFPGQGSQFAGMADPWTSHPAGKAVIEEASEALGRDLVAGCRDEALLETTEFTQPALLACDVAAFRVLEAEGVGGWVGAAGHSLGEFAALVAAGVFSFENALEVVAVRGRAMQAASDARPGAMTALIGVGAAQGAEICDAARESDVLIVANENSSRQLVISGSVAAIERAEKLCASRRIRWVRLKVAGAFHSPLMQAVVAPLSETIDALEFRAPRMPVASNVTGELVEDAEELRALSKRQVVSPVRWERCMRSLAAAGTSTFVEAGPGEVLTKLAQRTVGQTRARAVSNPTMAAAVTSAV